MSNVILGFFVVITFLASCAWAWAFAKPKVVSPDGKRRQYLDQARAELVDNELWLEHYMHEVAKNRARIARLEAEVQHDPDIAPSTAWGWPARNTEIQA